MVSRARFESVREWYQIDIIQTSQICLNLTTSRRGIANGFSSVSLRGKRSLQVSYLALMYPQYSEAGRPLATTGPDSSRSGNGRAYLAFGEGVRII